MEITLDEAHIPQHIEQIWYLVSNAQMREAKATSEALVQQLQWQCEEMPHERDLLQRCMYAHHIAGYAAALSTRWYDALVPTSYFGEMELITRLLQDDAHMVIALTYRGEMHRRYSDLKQALDCHQMAYDTPLSDSLDHFYALQRSLGKQALECNRASIYLREALQRLPPKSNLANQQLLVLQNITPS